MVKRSSIRAGARSPAVSGLALIGALVACRIQAQTVEFNRDIRPILSDKCFTCHGPDVANRKTKLRFDIESGATIELRSGKRAIVPGNLDASEAFRRITSADPAMRMPPAYMGKEKLKDSDIELIRLWIQQGAKWQSFWSFIAPVRPPLPEVRDKAWVKNPIDWFILSRLEREGLKPSPEADGATLIRRVTLDLTGLPPTPKEVDAFLADRSADAYEKLVDRLLSSPRYGERMAYRWMEDSRYGDTNGYQVDGPREMWRWRDWVIDAFNRNMPYDEFTVEQIAGDLLPHSTLSQKIATGFNRNHRTNGEGGIIPEEYRVEYVADRVLTTSTVFMGLTVGCARCHDHKYDPIPQKNFYQMFAYFNQIPNEKGFSYNYGNEEPFIKAPLPEQQQKLDALNATVRAMEMKYEAMRPEREAAQRAWEQRIAAGGSNGDTPAGDETVTREMAFRSDATLSKDVPATEQSPAGPAWSFDRSKTIEIAKPIARFGYLEPFTFAAWIKPSAENSGIFSQSEDYFEGTGDGLYVIDGKLRFHIIHRWTDLGIRLETKDPLRLNEWQHVLVSYDGKRKAAGIHLYVDGKAVETKILFDQLNEPFRVDEKVPFRIGSAGGMKYKGAIADVRVYKVALTEQEAAAVSASEPLSKLAALSPGQRTPGQAAKLELAFLASGAPQAIKEARQQVIAAHHDRDSFYDSIPTVMVMEDGANRPTFLLKRGAYDAPGDPVTPGVPDILPPVRPDWPQNRLGLAKWFVDRSNPLTARVTVNRFWQSYFGTGIVKTVDDFGSQGEWPVHPELLDWLAVEFMESGWNVKAMQKLIVTSATYRQASAATPEMLERDPGNRLLARGARFRLGPEVVRDEALAVSGLLKEQVGGPSVKPYQPAGLWQELGDGEGYVQSKGSDLYRRSLYTYWRRTTPPPFMTNFDAPNREVCTVYENRTNSPLQALDLMNDVTFLEASRKLAERMIVEGGSRVDDRLAYGVKLLLARPPRAAEAPILRAALESAQARYEADPAAASAFLKQGESPLRADLKSSDLAAYTVVASLLLNMDAAISKE